MAQHFNENKKKLYSTGKEEGGEERRKKQYTIKILKITKEM